MAEPVEVQFGEADLHGAKELCVRWGKCDRMICAQHRCRPTLTFLQQLVVCHYSGKWNGQCSVSVITLEDIYMHLSCSPTLR